MLAALLLRYAGRGLADSERRLLFSMLAVALAVRAAAIVVLFLLGIPSLNDMSVGALSGDEAYNLSRALRARDVLRGLGDTRYDRFVLTDEYGRNSYVTLLTWLQMAFGPTPYSAKLLNALFYTTGATILFRVARPAFGPVPAFVGLGAVLALPSLLYSSVTLLKDSLYFMATAVVFASVVTVVRRGTVGPRVIAGAAAVAGLWVVGDLRRGAIPLAVTGIVVGLILRVVAARPWRMAAAASAAALGLLIAGLQPTLRDRAVAVVASAARIHSGHVFTVGHAYKLLDDGFYVNPSDPNTPPPELTPAQALRFVVRGLVRFVVTPLPWEIASRSEWAFLPEHLIWFLAIGLLPFGLAAGWARDPLVATLLVGYVLPTAITLALTNDNIGTLLRLRGLVTPYWMWLSALGLCQVAQWVLTMERSAPRPLGGPHVEGSPG